jgi:hypothetical protein
LCMNIQRHAIGLAVIVSSWPIERDTGKFGASCGRVLFTLESMLFENNTTTSTNTNCFLRIMVEPTVFRSIRLVQAT